METPSHSERVRSLYQMLFEMATGNFTFRIRKSGNDDQLDELAKILNTLAAEMQLTILKTGYVTPHYSYQGLVQMTFVLDQQFTIASLGSNISLILGYPPEMLFGIAFHDILANSSIALWNETVKEAETDKNFHATIQLIFVAANRKLVPSFCTVSRLLFTDRIFVSSVTTILQDSFADQIGVSKNTAPNPSDSQLIQNVHDYILKNLEEPLPTVKELSKLFGTNEFRIKDGFRHFFNTSVYQFYNEERLKKAHLLIQQTDIPLKAIAFMVGFNDYNNFSKAFKKRFSYSPRALNRNDNQIDTRE
ncbi:helix-turn-helix domain-containing protein [Flavobacterium sp.]|uniref:helix-turn-helix domain-containing protein n=1 Tax=Flavobacterium sp. TaxID=239 RepID=UPI0026210193|nr:helix-turn-helix domain-containing protein [Flavobacterium sp.]